MRFLRLASSFFNKIRSSDGDGSNLIGNLLSMFSKMNLLSVGLFAIPLILTFVVFITFLSIFNNKMSLFQMVDPSSGKGSRVGVDLNYDFEDYARISAEAAVSSGNANADLANSEFKTVSNFNQHIADSVNQAGYGTRQGVVTAGVTLAGDYAKYTGKKIKYSQSGRQNPASIGIVNADNFMLDCSSFTFWSLYNGGFNIPSDLAYVQTDRIYEWATRRGYTRDYKSGIAGDFLVTKGKGHIVLIVGVHEDGYWVAEEDGTAAVINKRSFESYSRYAVVDMTDYYNDSSNVRSA